MKKFSFVLLASLLTFLIPSTINAKEVMRYAIQLNPRTYAETTYVTATENYKYALNDIMSTVGSPQVHSYYQTLFDGKGVTIGNKLTVKGAGYAYDSLWRAKNISSSPSGYNINKTANCLVGKNTTADRCAISGSKYRLKIANENLFNDITITGALVLTN